MGHWTGGNHGAHHLCPQGTVLVKKASSGGLSEPSGDRTADISSERPGILTWLMSKAYALDCLHSFPGVNLEFK